ncbi:hypothetical protein TNCT_566281 [Trichonephila clavata]|uniref:DDE-1 domain-containing protein n=1 Tax=Trichonephila clavata TaxID=2740835 RepID=A0A8X6JBY3_TRICU|nr:hypothetical protein TNCT_566281 [Trichonephila clavata]
MTIQSIWTVVNSAIRKISEALFLGTCLSCIIETFLKALIVIDKAWRAVTPLTIHSCFKKSGFPTPNLVDVDDTLTEFNAEPSLWEALPEQDLTFDDYVLVGMDIAVSDVEIVALDHNNTESDEDESELTPVTVRS